MKNVTAYTLLLLFPICQRAYAQANCDELKKEVEYLKKALQITTPVKTITSSQIDFNFLKCEGNTKTQTVDFVITLVNRGANRVFQFHTTKSIDLEGNEYDYPSTRLGAAESRNTIYTDVPIKAVFTFKKVLPSVKMFKIVPISYFHGDPGNDISIEFKDIPIVWK